MAHLLSEEDFRGDINVSGTEQTTVAAELCRSIEQHEPSFMEAVLGYVLSKAFYDGAAATTHDQRWEDLWNGCEWSDEGRLVKWVGLKYCASRYVYFKYMGNLASLTTTSGEKIAEADNATAREVNDKAFSRWSEMRSQLHHLADFLRHSKDSDVLVYPEWEDGKWSTLKVNGVNRWGI